MKTANLTSCFEVMAAYRLEYEKGRRGDREDRQWLARWPCRSPRSNGAFRAHIYIHGPGVLGYTHPGPQIAKIRSKLLSIQGVKAWQTGDREFSVIFPLAAVPEVAAVVHPLRRGGNHKPDQSGLRPVAAASRLGDLVVLFERHAPRLGEYIASAKIDPPISLVRVHRADLVAAVEEEGRQGRIGCVGCWDTLQKRVYAEAPRWPGLADVGRETKA